MANGRGGKLQPDFMLGYGSSDGEFLSLAAGAVQGGTGSRILAMAAGLARAIWVARWAGAAGWPAACGARWPSSGRNLRLTRGPASL